MNSEQAEMLATIAAAVSFLLTVEARVAERVGRFPWVIRGFAALWQWCDNLGHPPEFEDARVPEESSVGPSRTCRRVRFVTTLIGSIASCYILWWGEHSPRLLTIAFLVMAAVAWIDWWTVRP